MQQVAGPEPAHDDTEQVSAADRRLRQGILAIFRSHHIRAGQVLMAHQVNLQFLTDGRTAADYAAGLSYARDHRSSRSRQHLAVGWFRLDLHQPRYSVRRVGQQTL